MPHTQFRMSRISSAEAGKEISKAIESIRDSFLKDGIAYKNKEFRDSLNVLFICDSLKEDIKFKSERLTYLLEKVISLFKVCEKTQSFFMLQPKQKELALLDPGYSGHIKINRFDGLISKKTGAYKIIENNSDCPAGILFTSRLMKLMRSVQSMNLNLAKFSQDDKIQTGKGFFEEFIKAYQEFESGESRTPSAAILQIEGKENVESIEMAAMMNSLGVLTKVIDPRKCTYENGVFSCEGHPVDLVWNKINTSYFDEILHDDKLMGFLQACRDKKICHINSFASRYIVESKLCSAYLCSSLFQETLTESDRNLLKEVIPWSQKLCDQEVNFNGNVGSLKEIAINYKDQLVLKRAYDIRGEGVTLGKSVSIEEWEELLRLHWNKAYILQEYIEPVEEDIQLLGESSPLKRGFSLDVFMHGGLFQGFGSKASLEEKLNIFQGGSKLAVFSNCRSEYA